MKYKVLQRFITKNNVYTPGDVYSIDTPGKFTKRLLEYGFVEKTADEDKFDRWQKEGIVSQLANVIIAPEDYTEGDKVNFTFDEAKELEKSLPDGWRLPTRKEWVLICEEFAWNNKTKDLDPKLLTSKIKIPLDQVSILYYWSRTAYSSTNAYYLAFSSSALYPADYSLRYFGYSVRLVKEIK